MSNSVLTTQPDSDLSLSHRNQPPNNFSGSSCTLLPAFNHQSLASNAASSSNGPLVASYVPRFSNDHCPSPLSMPHVNKHPLPSNHVISFSFCGEDFSYDLDTLENDPNAIIALLKATLSERGNWMAVGARYRRSGNAKAAISVIDNFISFMTAQGYPEGDLKPAYLLLSGCETDLAKVIKEKSPSDAEVHYKRSQHFLQKALGTNKPLDSETKPMSLSNTQQEPVSTDNSRSQSKPTLDSEQEIQSLRSERQEQSAMVAELRAAKRKLEDEVAYECSGRRRLLREYDDLKKELSTARKMENHALSQVKREVEARRKAEETARVEKDRRIELEKLLEQCTTIVNMKRIKCE
ncbi:hypothetical protein H0H92_009949 [Tricholoma furcatifolium]|nr:hypothetical protein H0H92_009949 [Tricholoma furcatifolium]